MKHVRTHRTPEIFTDTDGTERARVPLAHDEGDVIVEVDDLAALVRVGLSLQWALSVQGYPRVNIPGRGAVAIGRLVSGAQKGEQVRYIDGNPCNLRKNNILIAPTGSTGLDADALDAFLQQQRTYAQVRA